MDMCCCLTITLVLILFNNISSTTAIASTSHNTTYEWRSSSWSTCTTHDPHDCCQCSRKRITHCVIKNTSAPPISGKLIPPFYCRKLSEPEPHETEICEHCDRDCVHSLWGDWSPCSETCHPATRYRTRQVRRGFVW